MVAKICGITTLEDALTALAAGANLLGFNFYPSSPRYISPAVSRPIVEVIRSLYPEATLVGVFVNAPVADVLQTLEMCRLDLAQLSGDEPPEEVKRLGPRAFKAFRPRSRDEVEAFLRAYPLRPEPPACLVDALRPGFYGGSGQRADWQVAMWLSQRVPILLAGGLTPENVGEAITQVRPWGVDVASGVESAPGRKDKVRMEMFLRRAHEAYAALSLDNSRGGS
ncbi:phosphoribosylanthranilate isomerase [uncultured Thermanaerothrix sp.]|uniref:phosphoribosylanthranilate isomerase n=1 Tax=uncultured Thermanaerothrix sp. TaxID=1195149 RepID=UPI00260BAFBF|nr:phosphoribosylanthranilate isomerase [uncultured Thermanaerothrix sp.]